MAEKQLSRVRILALLKIMNMFTDDEHPMAADEICKKLNEYGIKSERKTLYRDIAALKEYGTDIIYTHAPKSGYFIGERNFEPPEIRLLMDAVLAAPFITDRKTAELTDKLKGLLSVWQADEAAGQIHVESQLKFDNEEIYYAIYTINRAVANNRKISFEYHHRVISGNKAVLDSGRKFIISPYALIWESDKYYLAGNYQKYDSVSAYRIDRMKHTEILDEKSRPFEEVSGYRGNFDAADYARKTFHMYHGKEQAVELRCSDSVLEVILDRFGNNTRFNSSSEGAFTVSANVYVSEGLIEWLLQYGDKITVLSPEPLKREMANRIRKLNSAYHIL